MLTEVQQKFLKGLVKNEVKSLKEHFGNAAYNIDASSIYDDVVTSFMGFDVNGYIVSEICKACDVAWGIPNKRLRTGISTNRRLFFNDKDKVFCTDTGRLYVAKSMKSEFDTQLGDL